MTIGRAPECLRCAHFDNSPNATKLSCAAFPDGIPERVYMSEVLHHEHLPGDHGLLFTPRATEAPPVPLRRSKPRR